MKSIYYCLLLSISAWSQPQWHALTNIPQNDNGTRFDDVFFINENVGWAANGWGATVHKTTDGGTTWNLQYNPGASGNDYYFRNIEFLNENVGFLGTLDGVFFKTLDGGTTWDPVINITPNPVAICGLDAVGSSTIYGCGAYFSPAFIIRSTNSGATWNYINMSSYATALVEVLFVDSNTGFAAGSNAGGGIILKTTNGGATWTQIYSTGISGEYVWKLQLLPSNPNVMFASVESVAPLPGKLLKSVNGGVSWISKPVPDTDIQAVGFLTENHGWMGGHHSGFLETFDAGTTWINTGLGSNLNRIFFINDNLAYASGATIYKFSESLSTNEFTEKARTPLRASVNPNPVGSQLALTVEFTAPDHILIELYDATGRFIKLLSKDDIDAASEKTYTFDFPYQSGAYILNLHTNTGRQSVKFVH